MADRLTAEELAAMRARCEAWTPQVSVIGPLWDAGFNAACEGDCAAMLRLHHEIEALTAERDAAVAREAVLVEALRALTAYPRKAYIGSRRIKFDTTWEPVVAEAWQKLLADPSPAAEQMAEVVAQARECVRLDSMTPMLRDAVRALDEARS